jgi:hypothetical protein
MTDRWSNPSGSLGIDRFRVWPAGSDNFDHTELASNFDNLDAIIGVPSTGDWPPTTGIDGGIYAEVLLLQDERLPIGTVVPWFRPNGAAAIPTNWAACDGSTLTSGNHNFPGIAGSVTLPDLRNKFILGANAADANGAAAAAVGDATIDTATGAPGPQTSGGSNKIVQTTAQMPGHSHTFTGNALGAHVHSFTGNALGQHEHEGTSAVHDVLVGNNFTRSGTGIGIVDVAQVSGGSGVANYNFTTGFSSAGTPSGVISSVSAGTPSGSISTVGSGSPMDNRPNWYGLIYICKVKYAS